MVAIHAGITGASGLIGHAVAEALKTRGHHVRCLVRSSAVKAEQALGERRIAVDLESPNQLKDALAGLDTVIHLAFNTTAPNDLSDQSHIRQARALVSALKGTKTVITHISSYAVFDWLNLSGQPEPNSPTISACPEGSILTGYAHKKNNKKMHSSLRPNNTVCTTRS